MSKQFLLDNVSVDTVGTAIFGDGSARSLIITGTLGGGDVTIIRTTLHERPSEGVL